VHKRFEEWRKAFIAKLCAAYRVGHIALRDMEDWDKLTEREALAIRWQPCFEYWADSLSNGTPEEQMGLFRERQVIGLRIEQVLNDTPVKSNVA